MSCRLAASSSSRALDLTVPVMCVHTSKAMAADGSRPSLARLFPCPVLLTSPNGTASRFPTGSGRQRQAAQRSAAVFNSDRRGAMPMPMPILPRLASNEANLLRGSCRDREPKSIHSMSMPALSSQNDAMDAWHTEVFAIRRRLAAGAGRGSLLPRLYL
jgi:hypothetical protein